MVVPEVGQNWGSGSGPEGTSDAVGKETGLAFLRVCVLDLQRRGSQTVFGKVFHGFLDGGQPNPLPFNSLSDTWPCGQGEGLIREHVRNLWR